MGIDVYIKMALEKVPRKPGKTMVKYIIILVSEVVGRPSGIISWYGLPEDGETVTHRGNSLFINKANCQYVSRCPDDVPM
jgi:hypothetical protein